MAASRLCLGGDNLIKGVIFDFDGTLFDSLYVWDTVAVDFLKLFGKTPQSDIAKQFRNMDLRQAANYYIENYNIALSQEEIMQGINDMVEERYEKEVLPKEGIAELLEKLKSMDIKMCIATATDKYLIEKALKRCNLEKYFIDIFSCSDIGHSKDEPHIYRAALECLKTQKSETAVFEDNLYALATAKNDGFKAVGVKDNHNYNEKEKSVCDLYLDDYLSLAALWNFIEK